MPPPDQTIQARYRLQFSNQVKSPAFTNNPVDPIAVAIYDTYTQSYISSECLISSAKVRLMVLSAKPWENKGENWSRSEFNKRVLSPREGKAPILTGGSLTIRLKNGLGTFGNIIFTDNSSWSNGAFRLGVMVEGGGEEGFLNGERVLEGVSEPIRVKDRRGKDCQKPDLLELTHNVERIRRVGKGRAALLQKNNIKTVENFLWWYKNKQPELREILGIKSESDQGWMAMIEHAMKRANEFHAKYNASKESMSNSGYVGLLSPHKKAKIKIVLKFIITVLAGPRSRTRIVPPAIYNPMENTSQPQQALYHPMGRSMSLSTNGGPPVVGSGSSESNPCENQIIEGYMPAIYGPFTALCHFSSMIVLSRDISTASGEHIVETQHPLYPETNALVHPMGSNMSFCTNGWPPVVGSGPSEPNRGDMPIYMQFSAICDISSMFISKEHISTASGDHIAETQHPLFSETTSLVYPMGRNISLCTNGGPPVVGLGSSEPNPHENDINEGAVYSYFPGLAQPEIPDNQAQPDYIMQSSTRSDSPESFVASLFNNEYVEPLTLRKKRKMMALVRSVTFLAVPRKRARIVPPANQTTVPAI